MHLDYSVTNDSNLMTVPEVIAALQISRTKLYYLVQDGVIPVVRIGRSVRFERGEVHRLIRKFRTGFSRNTRGNR